MGTEIIHEENRMTVFIKGEIDHHAATEIRTETDGELERTAPELLVFDMSAVTFMDSSGVGLVLGRVRVMDQWGGKVLIASPSVRAEKILRLSGLGSLIIKKPSGKGKR